MKNKNQTKPTLTKKEILGVVTGRTKEVLETVKVITDDFKTKQAVKELADEIKNTPKQVINVGSSGRLPELKKGDKCKAIGSSKHIYEHGEIIEFIKNDGDWYLFINQAGEEETLIKGEFKRIPEVKKTISEKTYTIDNTKTFAVSGHKPVETISKKVSKENRTPEKVDAFNKFNPMEAIIIKGRGTGRTDEMIKYLETKMNKLIEENREINATLRRVTTDLNRAKSDLSLKEGYLATAKRTIETRTKRIDYLERDLTDIGSDLRNSIELSNKRLRTIKVIGLIGFILSLVSFLVGFNI